MSRGWKWDSGSWWVLCDVCNKKTQANQTKQRWDGFIVCKEDWEVRHPQDFVKATTDKISVPFTRPRGTDEFVTVNYINDYFVADYVLDVPPLFYVSYPL